MIKFIEKPILSAPSVAFLIVATALLKNVSQIAAASLAASDDLINAEGGRTRCSADGETVKELFDEYLVPVLDVYAERFPWTQQAAFHGMDRNNNIIEWNWAGGYKDWETMEPATEDTLVAGGSTTKPITATAIMQQIQLGTTVISDVTGEEIAIDIDVTANHFVDDLLRNSMDGKTMETLFPERDDGTGWGSKITIGQLLEQTTCISDYEDSPWSVEMQLSCNNDKTVVISPFDYMRNPIDGKYLIHPKCELGKHRWMSYSGINYILLGLVLTKLQGLSSWDQIDQLSMFPEDWQQGVAFSSNECSQYGPNIGGQYYLGGNLTNFQSCGKVESPYTTSWDESIQGPVFVDLGMDGNCLNGWTMGNGAYSAKWYSKFQHSLYTGKLPLPDGSGLLDMESVQQMFPPKCEVREDSNGNVVPANNQKYVANGCTNSFDPKNAEGYQGQELGSAYGFGAFLYSFGPNITNDDTKWNQSYVIGHGGMDYATEGANQFFTDGKFSIVMMKGPGYYDNSWSVNWGRNKETGKCDCLRNDDIMPWYQIFDLFKTLSYEICHEGESFSLNAADDKSTSMFCGSDDTGCRKTYDWYLSQNGSSILECLAEAGGVQKSSVLFEDSHTTCKNSLDASSVNISREETDKKDAKSNTETPVNDTAVSSLSKSSSLLSAAIALLSIAGISAVMGDVALL